MKTPLFTSSRPSAVTAPPPAARHHAGFSPSAEAHTDRQRKSAIRWESLLPRWSGGFLALACVGWLPMACGAQEAAPEQNASYPLPHGPWSPEGRQLLVVMVGLAVALVLMERFCAWRLRVQRRQAGAASRALLDALPSASSVSPVAPRAVAGSGFVS